MASESLVDDLLGYIKTEKDARHFPVDEADLKSGIVIIFLECQRSKRLQGFNYLPYRHNGTKESTDLQN